MAGVERGSLYLYGIVELRGGDLGLEGLGIPKDCPDNLKLITHKDIVAIARDAARDELCVPTKAEVQSHERVLEGFMEEHTVLPVSFGTLAKDEHALRGLLSTNYPLLCDTLTRLRGRVEVGLKAFWNREKVLGEVEREVGSLEGLRTKAAGSSGAVYAVAVRVGQRVESVLKRWRTTYVEAICEELREACVDMRVNENLGAQMLLNAAFLVDKPRRTEFEDRVTDIDSRYGDFMRFRYVGPLPPYNFADIHLKSA